MISDVKSIQLHISLASLALVHANGVANDAFYFLHMCLSNRNYRVLDFNKPPKGGVVFVTIVFNFKFFCRIKLYCSC